MKIANIGRLDRDAKCYLIFWNFVGYMQNKEIGRSLRMHRSVIVSVQLHVVTSRLS